MKTLAELFNDEMEKLSTESVVKERVSIQDQLLRILNPDQKFASIADKLNNMKERAGIFKLQTMKKAKKASAEPPTKPIKLFELFPKIKDVVIEFVKQNPFTDKPALKNRISSAAKKVIENRKLDVNLNELMTDDGLSEFLDYMLKTEGEKQDISNTDDFNISYNSEISDKDRELNSDILSSLQSNDAS